MLENFCKKCRKRWLAKSRNCLYCGCVTSSSQLSHDQFFVFPIYTVGFFNFDIDFSPFLDSKNQYFSYKICPYCNNGETKNKTRYWSCEAVLKIVISVRFVVQILKI